MHDIDEYTQGQLNFTAFVSREGGTFVAKIVCGSDISLLYQKLPLFFSDVSGAKNKIIT